ncbi:MAG: polysaccharide deacetylase family protein [Clostridiales bacterium]
MKILFLRKKQCLVSFLSLLLICSLYYSSSNFLDQAAMVDGEPYYQGSGANNKISLTINVDWGEEFLPDILKILDEANVKATFFLTGRWTDKNPQLAQEIAKRGHEIGNHAYIHQSPDQAGLAGNREEIRKTSLAIEKAIGSKTTLYAPPSGEKSQCVLDAAEAEGHTTILWSVDTVDWKRPAPDVIMERVMKKIHPGAIILAHPTHPTMEALPALLKDLQDQGYQLVTVSENLELRSKDQLLPQNNPEAAKDKAAVKDKIDSQDTKVLQNKPLATEDPKQDQ